MAQNCVPERSIYYTSPRTQNNRGSLPDILVRLRAVRNRGFIPDSFKISLHFNTFISTLECTHLRIHWVLGIKRPQREAKQSYTFKFFLSSWVRVSWINVDQLSNEMRLYTVLLYFCRQLYMFRVIPSSITRSTLKTVITTSGTGPAKHAYPFMFSFMFMGPCTVNQCQ